MSTHHLLLMENTINIILPSKVKPSAHSIHGTYSCTCKLVSSWKYIQGTSSGNKGMILLGSVLVCLYRFHCIAFNFMNKYHQKEYHNLKRFHFHYHKVLFFCLKMKKNIGVDFTRYVEFLLLNLFKFTSSLYLVVWLIIVTWLYYNFALKIFIGVELNK